MEVFVRLLRKILLVVSSTGLALITSGCASSPVSVKTFEDPAYIDASFTNILVIGVGNSYDSRSQWERVMVSRISSSGASATAFYSVAGDDQEINRDNVLAAVQANGSDAVLVTRVQSQGTDVSVKRGASTAKASRMNDGPIDLFRYDYEVLNNPDTINIETTAVLATELFEVADERKIWAIETTVSSEQNLGYLIDDSVDMIVAELHKDRLIGR